MKINLDGITLEFEVLDYQKSIREIKDRQWCKTKLSVVSNHINYFEDSRIILSYELEMLKKHLEMLVNNQVSKSEHIFLSEPVVEFRLRPATDEYNDIDMYWIINLRDDSGVVTANNLQLLFDRAATEKFLRYLNEVTKPRTAN